jgi:hypothetical protein
VWAAHGEQEVARVEEGGGGGVQGSGCARQRKGREMGLVPSAGATGQKRKGRGAGTSGGHGGDEVAAGRRSGWRGARGKGQWGRKAGPGKGESDACGLPEQEVAPGRDWSGADSWRQRGRGQSRGAKQGARGRRRGKGV